MSTNSNSPLGGQQLELTLIQHTLDNTLMLQRAFDGYVNATAMCKAAGKAFADYRRLATTQAFMDELSRSMGIPMDLLVVTNLTGRNEERGTWIHPDAAIHLGQWCSPKFAVAVAQWVREWMAGSTQRISQAWQCFHDRISLAQNIVPEGYFSVFKEMADMTASMITSGVPVGDKTVPDISVGSCWGRHWANHKLEAWFGERIKFEQNYPDYFPQAASNPHEPWAYPEAALPAFRKWMREVYFPEKFPAYLTGQVNGKALPVSIAQTAINAVNPRRLSA